MKKGRLKALFLLTYLLVASLPIVTLFLFYWNDSYTSAEASIVEDAKTNTSASMAALDSHLSILANIPRQLATDKDVLSYKNTGDTLERGYVIDQLQQMISGNALIEDIYVYFRPWDSFVSAYTNSYDSQALVQFGPKLALHFDGISYEELFTRLRTQYGNDFWPVQQVRFAGNARSIVTLVDTLPQNNRFAFATTLIMVNTKEMEKLIRNADTLGYALYSPGGMQVINHLPEGIQLDENLSEQDRGARIVKTGSEKQILSWEHSAYTHWKLVRVSSMDMLGERLNLLRSRFLLVVAFISSALAALIFFAMRKTYAPVGNLAAVAHDLNQSEEKPGNAFDLIDATLRSLHTQNEALLDDLNHENGYKMERWAQRLVHTPPSQWTQELFEKGEQYGLNMRCDAYQILILHYLDSARMQAFISALSNDAGSGFICSVIENVYNQMLVILGGEKSIIEPADRVDLTYSGANIIAVGTVVDSPRRWNESLSVALAISNHALLHRAGKTVFRQQDLPQDSFSFDRTPWSMIGSLDSATFQSDPSIIRNARDQVCQYIQHEATNYIEARMVVCQILSGIREKVPELSEEIGSDIQRLSSVRIGTDASEMAMLLSRYIDAFISTLKERQGNENHRLIEQSLLFIDQNIDSMGLSLNVVAESVGLSASRYSTLFTQYMHINYKVYVDTLRVNRAKQMLTETDLMVYEIAKAVGYDHAYSFARLFKKEVGMTPNEYRIQFGNAAAAEKDENMI